MNNNNLIIAAIAAAVILAIAKAQAPTPAPGPFGRYQLLSGQHHVVAQSTEYTEPVFLRIDTVTGETSEYESGINKAGKAYEYWLQIAEKP
jgi:hypothetical protein